MKVAITIEAKYRRTGLSMKGLRSTVAPTDPNPYMMQNGPCPNPRLKTGLLFS
jgi:hypothetical protein